MLLAEELLLIALDDASGRDVTSMGLLDVGLAGAVLLDLSLAGAVTARDGKVVATGTPDDPLLADAAATIRAQERPRDARHWVKRLPKALRPLRERVARRLVERGVLREERRRLLGLIPVTRWPEADPSAEEELRARLCAALVDGAEPDARTALLVSLLDPLDLVGAAVPREARRAARRRAKAIADRGVVGTGLDQVVKELQAAVMVSVVAATAGATTAASS